MKLLPAAEKPIEYLESYIHLSFSWDGGPSDHRYSLRVDLDEKAYLTALTMMAESFASSIGPSPRDNSDLSDVLNLELQCYILDNDCLSTTVSIGACDVNPKDIKEALHALIVKTSAAFTEALQRQGIALANPL